MLDRETYLRGVTVLEREARRLPALQQLVAMGLNQSLVRVGHEGLSPAQESTVRDAAGRF